MKPSMLGKAFVVLFFCCAFLYTVAKILQANQLLPGRASYDKYLEYIKARKPFVFQASSLINGRKPCSFPTPDPFDANIMTFIKKYPTITCSENTPSFVYATSEGELRVDPATVNAVLRSRAVVSCTYRNVSVAKNDAFSVEYGPWSRSFPTSIRLLEQESCVHVKCFHQNRPVSQSLVTLVRRRVQVEMERLEDFTAHLKKKTPKETLSILMVGLKGMSKENLARTMPKTKKFLMDILGAIELKKFNKVGMSTFSNVMPLLTGHHAKELPARWETSKYFDSINHLFLWSQYQKAGFRTSMVLDESRDNAFYSYGKGWTRPPVDYFPRQVVLASEAERRLAQGATDGAKRCIGQVPEISYLLDYCLDLATEFNKTTSPYLAYSFFSQLTHNDQNRASAGDELYLKFFQDVARKKVLDNTVLLFFSDHGSPYGDIAETPQGAVESKLPFAYFVFPPWFHRKYVLLMENFRINAHRLVTAFDLHATLVDLLTFAGSARDVMSSQRAISLFSKIPYTRTCKDAGIDTEFCACRDMRS